jgi:hypothetical protein
VTSAKPNGFNGNDRANTLATSSNWLEDNGKQFGHTAGVSNRRYGWSGGQDLKETDHFDPMTRFQLQNYTAWVHCPDM